MTTPPIQRITSREDPMIKRLRQLSGQSNFYRTHGHFWLEGDHLCSAALSREQTVTQAFFFRKPLGVAKQTLVEMRTRDNSFARCFVLFH